MYALYLNKMDFTKNRIRTKQRLVKSASRLGTGRSVRPLSHLGGRRRWLGPRRRKPTVGFAVVIIILMVILSLSCRVLPRARGNLSSVHEWPISLPPPPAFFSDGSSFKVDHPLIPRAGHCQQLTDTLGKPCHGQDNSKSTWDTTPSRAPTLLSQCPLEPRSNTLAVADAF